MPRLIDLGVEARGEQPPPEPILGPVERAVRDSFNHKRTYCTAKDLKDLLIDMAQHIDALRADARRRPGRAQDCQECLFTLSYLRRQGCMGLANLKAGTKCQWLRDNILIEEDE